MAKRVLQVEVDDEKDFNITVQDGKVITCVDVLECAKKGVDHTKMPWDNLALKAIAGPISMIKVQKGVDLIQDAHVVDVTPKD